MLFHYEYLFFILIYYTLSISLQYILFSDYNINPCDLLSPKSSSPFRDGRKSDETFLNLCFFFNSTTMSPSRPSRNRTQGAQMRHDDKIHAEFPYESVIFPSIDNLYTQIVMCF